MGIYGALSTAVTGLRAQSFALENISGNIANSQTTGFKRIDTDFVDMIPDAAQKRQTAGSVLGYSRSTNNIQGDIKGTSTETNMAINGNGFFVVEPPIGMSDGDTLFAGANYYTRRGDFELDKNGYLVNGSGYYLKGLPIDPTTRNISSSVPQVLQVSSAFLPAQQTSSVNYELNLPQLPKTAAYQASKTPGSELLRAQDFLNITPDTAATTSGATTTSGAAATTLAQAGNTLTITVNGTPVTLNFNQGGPNTGTDIDVTAAGTVGGLLTAIQTAINGALPAGDRPTIALNASGAITVTGADATDVVQIADNTTGTSSLGLGLADGTYNPTVSSSLALQQRVNTVSADKADTFIAQSISGGAVTVYAGNGAPANVQMRWAKVNSTANGGAEKWNLFILTNSQATGTGTVPGGRRLHLRAGWLAQPAGRDHRTAWPHGQRRHHRRYPPAARHLGPDPVRRSERQCRSDDAQPERLRRGRVRLGLGERQRSRRGVVHQRPAARSGPGGHRQLQRRQCAQAHGWRRVRGDLGIGRAAARHQRGDRVGRRGLEHRYLGRVHQADRYPAGLCRRHPYRFGGRPDAAGIAEHDPLRRR